MLYLLTNTKMYIDLLKTSKNYYSWSIYKIVFKICFNLEPIWFVSLHFISLMEDEYISWRCVRCLMNKALRYRGPVIQAMLWL
jgi:hypothetical protein